MNTDIDKLFLNTRLNTLVLRLHVQKLAPEILLPKEVVGTESCEGTSSVIESSSLPRSFICFCANKIRYPGDVSRQIDVQYKIIRKINNFIPRLNTANFLTLFTQANWQSNVFQR